MRWPATLPLHDGPDLFASPIFGDIRQFKPTARLGHVGRAPERCLQICVEPDRLEDPSPKIVCLAPTVIIILMVIEGS